MAENKRIRVSADASPLQELRQQVNGVWNEFLGLEDKFRGSAEATLNILQRQVDLLRERNVLMGGGGSTMAGGAGTIGSSFRGSGGVGGGFGSIFDRINEGVKRIADILEKNNRDEKNVEGGGGDVNKSSEVGMFGGGFSPKTSSGNMGYGLAGQLIGGNGGAAVSAIMRAIPWAALVVGIGRMAGSFVQSYVTRYNMADSYERANYNKYRNWFLRSFDFTGISSALYEQANAQLGAAKMASPEIAKYAALYGMSFNAANLRGAGSVGDGVSAYDAAMERVRAMEASGNYPSQTVNEYVERYGEGAKSDFRTRTVPHPAVQAALDRAAFLKESGEFERESWSARVLGLNYSQYLGQLADYGRAGAYGWNTKTGDINQLLMAEKIRGLSAGDAQSVLRVARFGSNRSYGGADVIQAMDSALAGAGFDSQYISSTLPEYLQLYSSIGSASLGKVGRINSEAIVRAITGIQRSTGAEGRQLERLANALTGGSISDDDVTQAMLLRTARQLAPNASYSELMAMKENMANDTALQKKFFENTYRATGGGERFRSGLVSMYGLSWSDAKLLDESIQKAGGFEKGFDMWRRGTTRGTAYSEEASAAMISDVERSRAASENEKIIEGFKQIIPEFAQQIGAALRDRQTQDTMTETIYQGAKRAIDRGTFNLKVAK